MLIRDTNNKLRMQQAVLFGLKFTLPLPSKNKLAAADVSQSESCGGHVFPHDPHCLPTSVWPGGKLHVIASQPVGAVDLGGLPWGNRSASCIDFYFHAWVIWVPALQPQLGRHQGQLGRRGICFSSIGFTLRAGLDALPQHSCQSTRSAVIFKKEKAQKKLTFTLFS